MMDNMVILHGFGLFRQGSILHLKHGANDILVSGGCS